MAMDISAFRQVGTDSGYVKANDTGKGVTQYGTGFFGKIVAWFRGPSASANKALNTDFLNAVRRTYGDAFIDNQVLNPLRSEGQQSKPLSARLVRHIIETGDKMLAEKQSQVEYKVHIDGKMLKVNSSHKDLESMRQAADRFLLQAKFDASGSALVRDIVDCLNRPDDEKKLALAKAPGGAGAARFVEAFEVGDGAQLSNMLSIGYKPEFSRHCAKLRINPSHITDAMTAKAQQPTRLVMLSKELAQRANDDPVKFKGVIKEMVEYVPNQVLTLKRGIAALSHPQFFEGMSEQDAQALTSLKNDLTAMLNEVLDPDGVCQHFLAYATVAAMDPKTAQENIKSVLPLNTQ